MACTIYRSPEGVERSIPDGVPYRKIPGEVEVGKDYECQGVVVSAGETIESALASEGIQWGDAVAWVTKKFGYKGGCSACTARQEIMNHGLKETIKAIKEGKF